MNNISKSRTVLWIVTEVFYPEEVATSNILTEIAIAIEKDSMVEIHVLCGPKSYEKNSDIVDYSILGNINLHRIEAFNFDKNNLIMRVFRLLFLSLFMFFVGLIKIRKNNKVLLVTNPATIIPLFAILKKIKKFNLTILMHDVFPENLLPLKVFKKSNYVYLLLKKIYDLSLNSANTIIVLGRDMFELMESKITTNTRVRIIENWADNDNVYPIKIENNSKVLNEHTSKIVIQYAGNLGRLQNLDVFINIFSKNINPLLHLVIYGRGAMLSQLNSMILERGINNVSIYPPFNRYEQNEYLNDSTIGLVSLTDELFGLGVPSKTYNIMAAEKPILFIGKKNTEIALMIKELNCGYVFEYNEEDKILDFLNNISLSSIEEFKIKAQNGREAALNKYSKTNIISKFKDLLINDSI